MTARELIENEGYENVVILDNYSFDSALIGVTTENRAVYDYDKMISYLVTEHGFNVIDAIEWVEYNTIRAIGYAGEDAPIVMYRLRGE